jgi:capsular exopolysaccharide synthesis family protein
MTNHQPNPFVPSPQALGAERAQTPGRPVLAEDFHAPGEPPLEREEGGGLPVLPLLSAWRRRWVMATAVGLVLGAAAAPAIWYLLPVRYSVFTLLRVASSEPRVLPTERGVPDANDLFRQTQVALVTGRPVIRSALRQEKVRELGVVLREEDPEAWLEKKLSASFIEGTEILKIGIVGEEHEELEVLVRVIQQIYLDEAVKAEQTRRLLRLDEIGKITQTSEEKIRTQRENLRQLAKSLKTTDTQSLTLRQRMKLEEYALLQKELASVRSQIRQTRTEIQTYNAKDKALKEDKNFALIEAEVNDFLDEFDPVVKRAAQEVLRQETNVRDTEKNAQPHMVRLAEKRLEEARKALEKARAERGKWGKEQLRKHALAHLRNAIAQAKDKLLHLEGQEKDLQKEAEEKGKEADAIGITSIELDMKRNEIEQAEGVIRSLRNEKEKLEIEVQSSAKRVTPLSSDGDIYKVKNTKSRAAMAGLGGAAAFLFGGLLVSLVEFSRRRVHSSQEVVRDLGLRLLGTLPKVPTPSSKGNDTAVRRIGPTQTLWAERVAGLRTALLLGGKEGLPAVLLVTSAGAEEGKTTLASHLAVSMASTGRKTLLIDCDLRRPVLHHVFETTQNPGFSEVLRGEADAQDVIRPTRVSGLFLLSAGEVDREALRALSHEKVGELFDWLRANYNCIIIDTSPVLPVADALLVGQYADGILMALRPKVSKLPRVKEAIERLKTLNRRFVGAVLNGGYEQVDADDYKYLNRYIGQG